MAFPNTALFPQPPQSEIQPRIPQAQQQPITDIQRMRMYNGILGAKLGYEQADRNLLGLNQALATPELNDAQRQEIQNAVSLNEQARKNYANQANYLRETANAIGLDVSDYGADKTAQESSQALNNYAATAVRDLLGTLPVEQQEQNRFNELMARGVKASRAHAIIKLNHAKTQNDFLNRLSNGIMTYGRNADGSINDVGLLLAQKMNPDPQVALTLFANAFAMPKDVFNASNNRDLAILGNTAAMERLNAQAIANWKNAEAERQFKAAQTDKTLAAQKDIALLRNQLSRTGAPDDKMEQELQFLTRLVGDEQKAAELYLFQHYNHAFDSLNKDNKILQDMTKFKTFTEGRFGDIEYFLQTQNYATAKDLIGRFREFVLSDDFKYAELKDADGAKFLLEQLADYELVADGKMTLDQLKAKQNPPPNSAAGLSQKNHDTAANQKAAEIAQKAATEQRSNDGSYRFNGYDATTYNQGKDYFTNKFWNNFYTNR